MFGFAEGRDALITVVFDTDDISAETFGRHWRTAVYAQTMSDASHLAGSAYTVFCAMIGREAPPLSSWHSNWRKLPTGKPRGLYSGATGNAVPASE